MASKAFSLFIAVSFLLVMRVCGLKDNKIYLGGFFPIQDLSGNNWETGYGISVACKLAVDLINNSTDILPNHRLVLLINNTKVREENSHSR